MRAYINISGTPHSYSTSISSYSHTCPHYECAAPFRNKLPGKFTRDSLTAATWATCHKAQILLPQLSKLMLSMFRF